MDETQNNRRRVLNAAIDSDGDTEADGVERQISANNGLIPRYAIVSEHGAVADGDSYAIDVADDADACLAGLAEGFEDHGYRPFLVIDLDSGKSRDVATVFALGDVSEEPAHDFSRVLA